MSLYRFALYMFYDGEKRYRYLFEIPVYAPTFNSAVKKAEKVSRAYSSASNRIVMAFSLKHFRGAFFPVFFYTSDSEQLTLF